MSYLVLARKWRPKTFEEVVGQSTVTRTLKNALASGRIGHAFLLSGARGVGKTTTARLLAKAMNCAAADAPTPTPCGTCASCVEIAQGTALDVQEIDGATHNGVEQVRDLRESARYNPARDRFKIWIIDEVHMLSTGAFNALLKTLEEPPPRVKFIFATTEYHKLPDTILSRCQQYEFRLIPTRELVDHLRSVAEGEKIRVSDEALGRIARAAEGSARDALSLFDQILAFSGSEVKDDDVSALLGLIDRELLLATSKAVAEGDSLALLDLVERLSDYGADYRNFNRELLLHFREILLLKVAGEASRLTAFILPDEKEKMRPLLAAFSEEDLLRTFEVLTKVETDLRWTQDPRVTLELALLKIAQMPRLLPFAELVGRVERLASGRPVSPAPSPAPMPKQATRSAEAKTPVGAPDPPPTVKKSLEGDIVSAMETLAQSRPTLAQALRGASAQEKDGTLVLEVRADFLALAVLHADDYRELARQALGRSVKIEIVAATPEGSTPGVESEETARRRLIDEAARQPAIQEVLDLFGGAVVEVRQNES
jgi:DNA polymerase-3 subunit gamma/tau